MAVKTEYFSMQFECIQKENLIFTAMQNEF